MPSHTDTKNNGTQAVPLLVGLAFLIGVYALLRFGGKWGEIDTSAFTHAIRAVLDTGSLVPPGKSYPNGYGYQALMGLLVETSGIELGLLQVFGSTLLLVWVVIPAWLAYRELTGAGREAGLATVILLAQPDFLFPLLRGTHEKFTRGLMLVCLYLLLRSMRTKNQRQTAGLVISFYLAAYAMITFNNLLATSFIAAVGLALLILWLSNRLFKHKIGDPNSEISSMCQRLGLVSLSLLLIAFIFTFYAYPPAQHQFQVFQNVYDRISLLFLQVEETIVNPYATVYQGWVNLPIYLLVSLANWVLLSLSLPLWLMQTRRLHSGEGLPGWEASILWAFYAAFALQGALSVLVDMSGAIASNLQHRIFPSFSMLAAPLVAIWLLQKFNQQPRQILRYALALGLGALLLLATLKATVEPALSNYWTFYSSAEVQAVSWAESSLQDRSLWIGFNNRVSDGMNITANGNRLSVRLDTYRPDPGTRDYLISDIMRLQSLRLQVALPVDADSLVTYDNGQAQIIRLRPHTPFQR
jgi:hypothetical protein